MEHPCPDAAHLAAFAAGNADPDSRDALTAHLLACEDCLGLVASLRKSGAPAARPAWRPLAAAAALLVAMAAAWALAPGEDPAAPAPLPHAAAAPVSPRLGSDLPAGISHLEPGLLVDLREGRLTLAAPRRLEMAWGQARIEHLGGGPLSLALPAGSLEGKGPWVARVDAPRPEKVALWCREALAAEAPASVVSVEEGVLTFRPADGGPCVEVPAGRRLRSVAGATPGLEAWTPPTPPGLRTWRGEALAALLGGNTRLDGGHTGRAWPLPLPPSSAYVLEVEIRPLPDSRIALAVPLLGSLRLWQLSGAECAPGGVRRLAVGVLGAGAWGAVDGTPLWQSGDAASSLDPAPAPAGLRVWGNVEIVSVTLRTPEAHAQD